jgi:hypothetical protein
MMFFQKFTPPLWEIFSGNLLLLICILFYLAWWVVTFKPGSTGGRAGVFSISVAFITGFAAIILLAVGINSLSHDSMGLPVKFILIGFAVLFVVLLFVTTTSFHRQVTSELIIIHIWAAIEFSAIAVTYGTGSFGFGSTVALSILVGVATIVGLVCYVIYYRLEGIASYRVGMVPLATDAFVVAVFLGMLAVN